jgi:hypothetical protein
MALAAIHRKALRPMIGTLRLVVCLEVAAHTLSGQCLPIELSHGSRCVTRVAIDNRMRADERKTVLVFVDVVHRHCPAVDVVAQIALGTILASMNVGVAVLALLTSIGEYGVDVTLFARNLGVQASQRKPGFAVIKLRTRTQRQPSFAGMAVLTRDLQGPMRISVGGRDAGSFLANGHTQEHEQQEPAYITGFEFP